MAEAAFDPDKYLAEKTAPQAPVSNFDPDAYLKEKTMSFLKDPVHNPDPNQAQLKDIVATGAHALDFPGGVVRTGLASAAGLVSGQPGLVTGSDLLNTVKGQAPKSSEYMQRLGVPPGPSVDIPAVGNLSVRDAAGFATDVATDPMTALAKGERLLNPAGAVVENTGKNIYKSGLKKVDERLVEKGATPLSDVLLREGAPTGTTKQLAAETAKINMKALADRARAYDQVKSAGNKIDVGGIATRANEKLKKMSEDPGLRPIADKLKEMLDRYTSEGFVDIDKASDWKSNLYNALPEAAYLEHGKLKGPVNQFQKALASDFKNAIIEAGEKTQKGLGQKIDSLNETMQTALTAKQPLAMQIRRGETPNLLTSVDAMLAGGAVAASHNPMTATGILAAKKAADLSKTTYARTKLGKGLMNAGQSGAAQGILNRGLINNER